MCDASEAGLRWMLRPTGLGIQATSAPVNGRFARSACWQWGPRAWNLVSLKAWLQGEEEEWRAGGVGDLL